MKNIHEEAFKLIYDDLAEGLERTFTELGSDLLDELDPKIAFYVMFTKIESGLNPKWNTRPFMAEVIFLHDVSDLNLSNLYTLTEDGTELIEERLIENSEYTNKVVDLITYGKTPALEKVWCAEELHYVISNSGQPGEVTQYHLWEVNSISIN